MKEDLNRHIPQKINEFASLALAGIEVTPSYKFWLRGGRRLKLHHDLDGCPLQSMAFGMTRR